MTTIETTAFDAASAMDGAQADYQWRPWERERGSRIASSLRYAKLHSSIMLRGSRGLGKRKFAERLAVLLLCENSVEKQAGQESAAVGGALFDDLNSQESTQVAAERGDDFACGACASCRLLMSSTHPDLYLLSPEEGKKQISVEAVRASKESLLKTPQVSSCKVCVIDPVEALNDNAANALLKLLEEPPEGTYFILVADQYSQVLPTIRSRCQTESFGIPEQASNIQFLAEFYELEESVVQALWSKHRGFVGDVIGDIEGRAATNDFQRLYFGFLVGKVARTDLLKAVNKETVDEFADEIARSLVKTATPRSDEQNNTSLNGLSVEVAIELYGLAQAFKKNLTMNPNLTSALNAFLLESRSCTNGRSVG